MRLGRMGRATAETDRVQVQKWAGRPESVTRPFGEQEAPLRTRLPLRRTTDCFGRPTLRKLADAVVILSQRSCHNPETRHSGESDDQTAHNIRNVVVPVVDRAHAKQRD